MAAFPAVQTYLVATLVPSDRRQDRRQRSEEMLVAPPIIRKAHAASRQRILVEESRKKCRVES